MVTQNGCVMKINTKITNYDVDKIMIPNNQNLTFKINSAIVHIGEMVIM